MRQVHIIYFSPGGTTKKTVLNIAKGMQQAELGESVSAVEVVQHDMLRPENRRKNLSFGKDDVVILGMMTATKLFGVPDEIFACLEGNDTPLVGVVLFGNGYYGSSLSLLQKESAKKGFSLVAAGAFIGQHTFNPAVATGRPDAMDKAKQLAFGNTVMTKVAVHNDRSFLHTLKFDWPRNDMKSAAKAAIIRYLPGITTKLPYSLSKFEISDEYNQCGACEKRCPRGAINPATKSFDANRCLGCFSCGNVCPQKAISLTHEGMNKIIEACLEKRKVRREPVLFL